MSYRVRIVALVLLAVVVPVLCSTAYNSWSLQRLRSEDSALFLQSELSYRRLAIETVLDKYLFSAQVVEQAVSSFVRPDVRLKPERGVRLKHALNRLIDEMDLLQGVAVRGENAEASLVVGEFTDDAPVVLPLLANSTAFIEVLGFDGRARAIKVSLDTSLGMIEMQFSSEPLERLLVNQSGSAMHRTLELRSLGENNLATLRSEIVLAEQSSPPVFVESPSIFDDTTGHATISSPRFLFALTESVDYLSERNTATAIRSDVLISSIAAMISVFLLLWNMYRPLTRLASVAKELSNDHLIDVHDAPSEIELVSNVLVDSIAKLREKNSDLASANNRLNITIEENKDKELIILNTVSDLNKEREKLKDQIARREATEELLQASNTDIQNKNTELQDTLISKEKVERHLAEKTNVLETVLNSIEEGLLYCNAAGEIALANLAAIEQLGEDILVATSIDDLTKFEIFEEESDTPLPAAEYPLMRALNGEHTVNQLMTSYVQSESKKLTKHMSVSSSPVVDNSGELFGAVSTFSDVTERRQQVARMEAANEELRRSNKDLDDFAYVASHDLKSPLRGIDNLAMWIQEDHAHLLPEDAQQDLATLRERVMRLENLLDGLLTYAKVGRTEEKPSHIQLKAMVEDIAEILNKPEAFSVKLETEVDAISSYASPLNMVLRNLIHNAIKHRTSDSGSVLVKCSCVESAYEFTVSDDGPGVPDDQIDKIFGLFVTVKRRDEEEASGLGLALVKRTIESLGGNISVCNNEKAGVSFTFTWQRYA